ncbi:MAG: hypothetical protein DHS20C01_10340 [marine bacterium B5-7]|nr:MAG: hypothetical protein DHS20C01_10340 [marine bacterium B5-7]
MAVIGVFGLGEAGSRISADLAHKGVTVFGYDPAPVDDPAGVTRVAQAVDAVTNADFVLGITSAADATVALEQAVLKIPAGAIYADFSTAAPTLKKSLATTALSHGIEFVDVALMAPVPGKGITTPVGISGSGCKQFAQVFAAFGMPVEVISDQAGDAALRKLLRSVMMKGLAALLIEAMRAGNAAGVGDWLWRNMVDQLSVADSPLLSRLVSGTKDHARRRLHEMEAAEELLGDLGIDPVMTRSTVESLRRMLHEDLPEVPDQPVG